MVSDKPGKADQRNNRDRTGEEDRHRDEAVFVERPHDGEAAHRAGELERGRGEHGIANRIAGIGEDRRCPLIDEIEDHQVDGVREPEHRRDPGEPALEDRAVGEFLLIDLVADDEIGIRIELEPGLHTLDLPYQPLMPLAFQRQELDRFRQRRHGDEGDDDRRETADPEQDLPAMGLHISLADKTRNAAAEGHAREHQDEERRAHAPRRELGDQRGRDRQHAGDADAGDEAQPDQLRQILRQNRGPGEYAEEQQAADDRAAASIVVRDPAEKRRAEKAGEEPRAEESAKRNRTNMPFTDQSWCSDCCRADVISVGHHHDEADNDQADMKSADLLRVDDARKIDSLCLRHDDPPLAPRAVSARGLI